MEKLTKGVLDEMTEHTMQESQDNTRKPLSVACQMFPGFRTHFDHQLERMVMEAWQFVVDMNRARDPRWISFIGNSGTGKTFISDMIHSYAYCNLEMSQHLSLINPVMKVFWPKLLSQLRDQDYWRVQDLSDCNFVFIDEVSVEHDPSGFAKDKLCEILSCRVNKWTVITSNLTLQKLAEIDARISSRMIRGKSVVVEVNTIDYALRKT